MRKIFAPLIFIFKLIYKIIDKLIVVPISRIIYKISEFNKDNSTKFEKILNRPNVLIYLSLICAIGLFLLVDSKVINLTEKEAEIISGQKITAIYNEEAYVVEGIPESVDITLVGSRSTIYLASQLSDHEVVLDLSKYSAGTYKVKLKYNHSVQAVNYKLDPSTVTVKISEKVSDTRNLNYDLVNVSKLDSKLSVSDINIETSEVVVKSSKEILENVASVKALVDASQINLKESGEFNVENIPLVAFDELGNKMENIEIVPAKVTAKVTVDSYHDVKPVKVIVKGNISNGMAISSIDSSLKEVTVYGEKAIVDALSCIEVEVPVENLSENKSISLDLIKPSGVRFMSDTKTTVNIAVGSSSQKTISGVSVQARNLGSDYIANAASDEDKTIDVVIKGVSSIIDSLEPTSIQAYVDLSGYKSGTHTLPVVVTVDDERVTVQAVKTKINVKVTQK